MHLPLNFVNYLGPGLGLGTIVIVLIVLFIVLISFFLIAWTPIKKLLRKAKSKPEKGGAVIKRNWVKYLVVTVLALAFLCGFSYCVHLVDIGSKSLGPLTEPTRSFATFPEVIHEALTSTEIRNIPPDYVRVEPDFVELNRLDYDLYGVNSFIEPDKSLYELRLFNLRNDSIIYSWTIHKDSVNFFSTFLDFDRCAPMAPLILDDLSVVTFLNRSKNMVRIDKDSKIKWENNSNVFHHTLNLNSSGDIWVCTSVKRGIKNCRKREHIGL